MSKEAARLIREYAQRTHQKHDIRVGCPRCDLTAALLACAIEVESANADTRANDGERRQGNDSRNDSHLRDCDDCAYVVTQAEADGRRQGWNKALDAARNAVAALENADLEIDWDRDYAADPTGNTRNPRLWLRDALAAIDALREERK
jgi:hypothetical protein